MSVSIERLGNDGRQWKTEVLGESLSRYHKVHNKARVDCTGIGPVLPRYKAEYWPPGWWHNRGKQQILNRLDDGTSAVTSRVLYAWFLLQAR
jgi:hypothetical protein